MAPQVFQQAIARIVTDSDYRAAIEANPRQLVADYPLDQGELEVMQQVWEKATGNDVVAHDFYCCCCCIIV
jgi:hypothetical protein